MQSVSSSAYHPSVSEILSRPTLTNGEKRSIVGAVDALQALSGTLPGMLDLVVALVPVAQVQPQDATQEFPFGPNAQCH